MSRFKVGDKVKYKGGIHQHLENKVLTVMGTVHFGDIEALYFMEVGADTIHDSCRFELSKETKSKKNLPGWF